jgi:SAM-dependent methyltransferase
MSVADHYQGSSGERYFAYQQRAASAGTSLNVEKFAPFVRPHDRVIDFGCGGGYLLDALVAQEKIGVEPAERARAAAQARGLRVVPYTRDLPASSADVVVSNHALEHTHRPLDELRELHRVLSSNGRLILRVPIGDWRREHQYDSTDINHHLYSWTPLLLGHLLTEAGFEVEAVDVVSRAWPPLLPLALRLPSRIFGAAAWLTSVIRRSREVSAIARRSDSADH